MTEDHFVIIGNGPAANSAALTLRECAPDTRVTMISRELVRQYKRGQRDFSLQDLTEINLAGA